MGLRFRQLRRFTLCLRESSHLRWAGPARDCLGVYRSPILLLAPADLDFPPAGLSTLRPQCLGISSHQRPAARRHHHPAVLGPLADDRRSLAQCLRGRRLRHPSAPGGIGRLGGRAEGRLERAVLRARAGRVSPLCSPTHFAGPIPDRRGRLSAGPDGQADAGYAPLRALAVGLLAAGPLRHIPLAPGEFGGW